MGFGAALFYRIRRTVASNTGSRKGPRSNRPFIRQSSANYQLLILSAGCGRHDPALADAICASAALERNLMMIRIILAAAALAGIAASTAVSAQTIVDGAPTVRIHYTGLDLSQPSGIKLLRHRVAMAVNTVCPYPLAGSMEDMMANARCRDRAIKGADQQIAAIPRTRAYAQADASGLPVRQ